MKDKQQKIFYIFHGRFPSEKAASLFAAKSCEALAGQGAQLTLLIPRRFGRSKDDLFEYYKVKKNFKVIFLPTIDLFFVPFVKRVSFFVSFIFFSITCFMYLLVKAKRDDIIYSNESLPLFLTSFFFPNTLYEVHDFPERKLFFYKLLFKRLKWVLATNKWKKEKLQKIFEISPKKIIYEPNAVEVSDFDIDVTKNEARKQLGLSQKAKIVVYTGHLYSWKGVDTLAESAKDIPKVLIFFIGGTDKDVKNFRDTYGDIQNIRIVGHRPHDEIPVWQKAADVLVLPNTAKEDISKFYTSPMKLFEYMASSTPIVASDIPSISELLTSRNSVLVDPDNPQKLAEGIVYAFKNEKKDVLIENALESVRNHTWNKRAFRIKEILKSI